MQIVFQFELDNADTEAKFFKFMRWAELYPSCILECDLTKYKGIMIAEIYIQRKPLQNFPVSI